MTLAPETRERIDQLVKASPVFLFMKGNPEAPQCGFSATVVQILGRLVPGFDSFDVLSDQAVREGIKEYAEWPTIPQLYVEGEFVGGCDIIQEMYANGELQDALGLERHAVGTVSLEIRPAALPVLKEAREQSGGGELHLSIDAHFQSSLGIGPPQPGELALDVDGLTVYVHPETAARATGVVIDAVQSDAGPRLTIDNPNAPRVGQLSPADVKALLDAGEPFEFFDVRSPEERARASIEGTRLLDDAGHAHLEALPRDTRIVFHCHVGARSQAAAEHFAAEGFVNVHNLEGGIDAWSQSVDPSVPRY